MNDASRTKFLVLVVAAILATTAIVLAQAPAPNAAAPAPRTIIIVRHGAYVPDATDSSPGPGLSPIGVAQARLVSARLAAMPGSFDAIYASPLTRAFETARVIASDQPGKKVEVLPDLAECTPATRRKEIIKDEKPEDMAACAAKLDALFAKYFVPAAGTPRRELFVAHGNVTRYLVTRALGVDTTAWLEMSVGHASFTQILVEADGRFKINSIGDIGHIPPNLQTGATGMGEKSLGVPAN